MNPNKYSGTGSAGENEYLQNESNHRKPRFRSTSVTMVKSPESKIIGSIPAENNSSKIIQPCFNMHKSVQPTGISSSNPQSGNRKMSKPFEKLTNRRMSSPQIGMRFKESSKNSGNNETKSAPQHSAHIKRCTTPADKKISNSVSFVEDPAANTPPKKLDNRAGKFGSMEFDTINLLSAVTHAIDMKSSLVFMDPLLEIEYQLYHIEFYMPKWKRGLTLGVLLLLTLFVYDQLQPTATEVEIYFTTFSSLVPLIVMFLALYSFGNADTRYVGLFVNGIACISVLILGSVGISARHFIVEPWETPYKTALFYFMIMSGSHIMFGIQFTYYISSMLLLLLAFLIENIAAMNKITVTCLKDNSICPSQEKWMVEMTISMIILFFGVTMISIGCYLLEKSTRQEFIKSRNNKITNIKLNDQLKKLHKNYASQVFDFDTPLEKSIMITKTILADPNLSSKYIEPLSMLLSLLKSGDLLSPDIQKQAEGCWVHLDEEQEAWLFSNLYRNRISNRTQAKQGSFSSRRKSMAQAIEEMGGSEVNKKKSLNQIESPPPVPKLTHAVETPTEPRRNSLFNKNTNDHDVGAPRSQSGSYLSASNINDSNIRTSVSREPHIEGATIIKIDEEVEDAVPEQKEVIDAFPERSNSNRIIPRQETVMAAEVACITLLLKPYSSTSRDNPNSLPVIQDLKLPTENFVDNLAKAASINNVNSEFYDKDVLSESDEEQSNSNLSEITTHTQLIQILEKCDYWNWEIFEFKQASKGWPLFTLSHFLFGKSELYSKFKIPIKTFLKFMTRIERGYQEVAYHNSTHATDVLHGFNWLKDRTLALVQPSDLELLSVYFAAIIHDFEHPGLNNNFLISTFDKKAILYNDRSVLENHHIASAFNILLFGEDCNFLLNMEKDEFKLFRENVIELVLATDLQAHHFAIIQLFKNKITVTETFDPINTAEDRLLLWKMMIKCADVSNPSKAWPIYEKWTYNVLQEFFSQGDLEKSMGLPISPYYDRETIVVPRSQIGFIEFICIPLFEAFNNFRSISVILDGLEENLAYWTQANEELLQQQQKQHPQLPHAIKITSASTTVLTQISHDSSSRSLKYADHCGSNSNIDRKHSRKQSRSFSDLLKIKKYTSTSSLAAPH